MATTQIGAGLFTITGKDFSSMSSKLMILIAVFLAYTSASIFPIKKGMKLSAVFENHTATNTV